MAEEEGAIERKRQPHVDLLMTTSQKMGTAALFCIAIGGILYQQHRIDLQARAIASLISEVSELRLEEASRRANSMTNPAGMSRADNDELLRLRGDLARLRNQTPDSSLGRVVRAGDTNQNRQPHFQYGFISRENWKNAGRATPAQAIETFFWAWTTKNEAGLLDVSAQDADGQPFTLKGLSTDFDKKILGLQLLNVGMPYPDRPTLWKAVMVDETMDTYVDDREQTFQRIGHGILKLWLEKSNGEWKFAGRAD
jgi:hypothetical protein